MSETKHTPGPWSVTDGNYIRPNIYEGADGFGTWPALCHVSPWPDIEGYPPRLFFKKEEMDANVRLIASAPDLLEACREAIHGLSLTDSDSAEIDEIRARIRAIVAKAEGK